MKQCDTRWKEDVREFRDFSDHVHCSKNSLQGSEASDRSRVHQVGFLTTPTWQTRESFGGASA